MYKVQKPHLLTRILVITCLINVSQFLYMESFKILKVDPFQKDHGLMFAIITMIPYSFFDVPFIEGYNNQYDLYFQCDFYVKLSKTITFNCSIKKPFNDKC